MTLAINLGYEYPMTPTLDRGVSEEADKVRELARPGENFTASLTSTDRLQAVLTALKEAFSNAVTRDWDGYNAHPADPGAVVYALYLLANLPVATVAPEVAVDTDGEIALEWDLEPRRVFSVRVSRDGTLNYAGLVGHESFHGVELMREGIPQAISAGIERVIRRA